MISFPSNVLLRCANNKQLRTVVKTYRSNGHVLVPEFAGNEQIGENLQESATKDYKNSFAPF